MTTNQRPRPSRTEYVGLLLLSVASLLFLLGFALTRTGRDQTLPLRVGSALCGGIGAALLARGLWRGWDDRATSGAAAVVSALLTFLLPLTEVLWIGYEMATLPLVVRDAETHQPVSHARVRVTNHWDPARSSAGQTDATGTARVSHSFEAIGRTSLVCDRGVLYLFRATVEVQAEGYEPVRERLETFTEPGWPLHGPPLPVVEVSLKKRGRP